MEQTPSTPCDAAPPNRGRRVLKRALVYGVFVLWIPVLLVVVASLMVGHWVILPRPPTGDPEVRAAVAKLRKADERGWMAVHVLYGECPCSRRVLKHVLASERPSDVTEKLVLVGRDAEWERKARAKGLDVDVVEMDQLLSKYHLMAAPMLLVVNPRGDVVYMGGYTARKQGPDIADLQIMRHLMQGERENERPIFGCAVGASLQDALDPLHIKYSR
ncbi:MAG: hypothetical protein R3B89_26405 [Polyangiaceae bacterium]